MMPAYACAHLPARSIHLIDPSPEHLIVEPRPFDDKAVPSQGDPTVENFYLSFEPYQCGQMCLPTDEGTYGPLDRGQNAVHTRLARAPQVEPCLHEAGRPGEWHEQY